MTKAIMILQKLLAFFLFNHHIYGCNRKGTSICKHKFDILEGLPVAEYLLGDPML
jgi:hypothetical protein